MNNLDVFKRTLPYASELFGIYQPLLGWRSRRITDRFETHRNETYRTIIERAVSGVRPPVTVRLEGEQLSRSVLFAHQSLKVTNLKPLKFPRDSQPHVSPTIDSGIARLLLKQIGTEVPEHWKVLIDYERMAILLVEFQKIIADVKLIQEHPEVSEYIKQFLANAPNQEDRQALLQSLFERECTIAGYLVFLAKQNPSALKPLFFKSPKIDVADTVVIHDPLLNFGSNNYAAVLSPIGIVHLYREYFFEFDSFLGPPVGHVWLSPGGTVELIETNTRKVFTERTLEMATETTTKSETTVTTQDELADAVKEENRNTTKFGFSNVASVSVPFFQDTATTNLSLDNAKANSRETTHKHMRQQSEKLSSEIKKSFKTTFKTSTEVTDTSSKRYVLENKTSKLVNYELRRKMRKVGVQVQDIGTQMCWQTFVDDAGRELGLANLVHIAQAAELGDLPQPEQLEVPQPVSQDVNINIPFVGKSTEDESISYTNGEETDFGGLDQPAYIEPDFPQSVVFSKPQYTLDSTIVLDPQGNDVKPSVQNFVSQEGSSTASFTIHLDYVHFHDQHTVSIKATLLWKPSQGLIDSVNQTNQTRLANYNTEKARRMKEAFYSAARDRIKIASKILPRPAEDLREEERTVVYRNLISQLMKVGTNSSKHVTSELVRSIFDVDKMLYFVAPEWWMPRLHRSVQYLGEEQPVSDHATLTKAKPAFDPRFGIPLKPLMPTETSTSQAASPRGTPIAFENIVNWGGGKEIGRDNYYITDESAPAKLGSSLGWLLQLDGDDLRNAMLNSPWVKAVIPIRLGKEEAAINWLEQAHVEGSDGLDAQYDAAPDDPPELKSTPGHVVTIRTALDFLIEKIGEFNQRARTRIVTDPADPHGPTEQFAGSLPTEAVFENGFYPLKGGVHFDQDGTEQAIFSQWIEILPTDQVAALEVEYDPKTLQVRTPT